MATWFDVMQVTAALCLAGDGSGLSQGRHSSPVNRQDATEAAALAGQQDTPQHLCLLGRFKVPSLVSAAIHQATRRLLLISEEIAFLLNVNVCYLVAWC